VLPWPECVYARRSGKAAGIDSSWSAVLGQRLSLRPLQENDRTIRQMIGKIDRLRALIVYGHRDWIVYLVEEGVGT
jgi:hypothetical protein